MDRSCVSSTCLRRRRGSTSVRSSGLHYLVCGAVIISVIILQLPSASFAADPSAGSGEGVDGSSSGSGPTPGSIPLNFIFLSSDNPRLRTSGSIPAVDIALEMVTQSGILGKYKLQYTEALDSQCDRTQSLDMFHEAVRKRRGETFVQNVAIIGAGCSVATLPVAEICHYYNLPMLSWSSTAAELSNRRKFRSNYRLAPSEKLHSPGLAALIRHYQWAQVAMLTQLESLFIEGQRVVKKLLPEVSIVTREFTTDRDPLAVEDFFVKSRDMRVFVLNMYVDFAKKILCAAVRRGMYYPRFLWITPGWYGDLWWEKELPQNCTLGDMEKVLSHSLSAVQYPLFSETETSSLGISTLQFRQLYGIRLYTLALQGKLYTVDLTAPLAFEAVWTLAKALRMTIEKIEAGEEGGCGDEEGELVPLERFDYSNDKLGCLLLESLDQLYFLGISGNVTFDEQGDRVSNTVRISQYQPGRGRPRRDKTLTMANTLVGYASFEGDGDNITGLSVSIVNDTSVTFPEGITPDGIPKEVIVSTALPLTVVYYILASCGIVFAAVCLLFNIIYRKRKIVRLTSPNLNYLIIVGAVLLYMSVFFWVSPAEEEMEATVLCNFRIWLFSIGNTLCLAVVLSKMWRVHYIFTSPSPKRKPKPPQDWHLLIIVLVIVSVDLVILLIPTAIDDSRSRGQLTKSQEHGETEDELGVAQIHRYYSCYSDSQLIWLFMSYIYKFLLQIAAIYFAFMSRKIRFKALNDSKEIAAIIYITSLLLVISAFGFWIGLLYLNTSTVVFGLAQFFTASVILGLLFIPKMISLRLDPQGVNIFSGSHRNTTTVSVNQSSIDILEAGHKMHELSSRVKELESELEKYQNGGSSNVTAALYTCNITTPTQTSPDSKLDPGMEPEP